MSMSKVTITIEDLPDGKVRTVCTPNFETMIQMQTSGHDLTPAHGYALKALNAIIQASKQNDPTLNVRIPIIGR